MTGPTPLPRLALLRHSSRLLFNGTLFREFVPCRLHDASRVPCRVACHASTTRSVQVCRAGQCRRSRSSAATTRQARSRQTPHGRRRCDHEVPLGGRLQRLAQARTPRLPRDASTAATDGCEDVAAGSARRAHECVLGTCCLLCFVFLDALTYRKLAVCSVLFLDALTYRKHLVRILEKYRFERQSRRKMPSQRGVGGVLSSFRRCLVDCNRDIISFKYMCSIVMLRVRGVGGGLFSSLFLAESPTTYTRSAAEKKSSRAQSESRVFN